MLRLTNVAVALAFISTIGTRIPEVAVPPAEAAVCYGDVNDDARVNVADAHLIARFAIGMRVANRESIVARGDVTGDGRVNVSDAQQVARLSVGLSTTRRLSARCR